MNPLKILDYEPLDKSKLSLPAKVLVYFIEYIARVMGAVYVSLCLLLVSIWPFRGASRSFFRIIGTMADMYRSKWMADEYYNEEEKKDDKDKS